MLAMLLGCRAPTTPPTPPEPDPVVLTVSAWFSDAIAVLDPTTGERLGTIRDVHGPQTVLSLPDGGWVACEELEDRLVRVDPASLQAGAPLVVDEASTPQDETGGLVHPDAATFGPDGRLYVASFETDQVLRYAQDGTFLDVVVAAGAGGLAGPDLGLSFDPGGALVVPGWTSNRVHRFDPDTGAELPDLVPASAELRRPRGVVFDGAGRAWVAAEGSGVVVRVEDGAVEPFATISGPTGLALDEAAGVLWVASGEDDEVRAFDLETGEDRGVTFGGGGLRGLTSLGRLSRPRG